MSDALLAAIPDYGAPALFLLMLFACLGFPLPASLGLLAAGAIAASGDLDLATVIVVCWLGAIAGDHLGYLVGARGGTAVLAWLGRSSTGRDATLEARAFIARRGAAAVYLSRWLVAPLGPPINLFAGAAGMPLNSFSPAVLLGEATWVGAYVGLGFFFSGAMFGLATALGDLGWFLASGVVAGVLLWWLRSRLARNSRRKGSATAGD